ncbi:hypothetical protein DYBT9623_00878 [Dyadobacter sp. CECT 9623]|uniref:Uncharacterized protein n=1 Tax=Dyadobacter linearis TaxID=2823330 RepID=A0ABM8UL82_9BACT|nr:hypothetical protein [Dyadobacter sp. CECT 9623]CAG5068149.1 hypothetical protein DYBT9623_00878 [Dyadobacter sp. CECT 9623]
MTEQFTSNPAGWFHKFCEASLGILAATVIIQIPLDIFTSIWEYLGDYDNYYFIIQAVLPLIGGAIYATLWQDRERTGRINSGWHHAILLGMLRYWLAYSISVYGFAKILKTQLQSPIYRLDMPLGDLNGFALTWYYFGYSYTLAVILGLFQVGGSILLLFRRTTLIGVMVLLPVMVNIVLINLFYDIAAGAFFNSIIYTIGLVYLLFNDFEKLKAAFWDLVERFPTIGGKNQWAKNGLRFLVIAAAFATIYQYLWNDKTDKILLGTWKVEKLLKNKQPVDETAWLKDSTAWNKVYFASWNGAAFSPNPYRYLPAESLRGSYEFDSLKNDIQFIFQNPAQKGGKDDTLHIAVTNRTQKSMHLHFVMASDTMDLQLARLR